MAAELPPGRYLTCAHNIRPEQGGTTRALLARNRIFAERGVDNPTVLSFAPASDLSQRRAAFLDAGLTTDLISVLNIFEHSRDHGWHGAQRTGEPLADLRRYRVAEEWLPDGTPWRTAYRLPGDRRILHDYQRPDGSAYLRIAPFVFHDARSWPSRILQVSPGGEVCGTFERLGQWFRGWVREVAQGAERTFLFIDTRQMVPHLVPMPEPDIHVVYVLHNNHLQPPRRWDSPVTAGYERVLNRIGGMDALVCLTERQRGDIARRQGATTNMFVVPNPIQPPEVAEVPPRDCRRVSMLTRLTPQKRLVDAIRAFELVVQQVPDARLDVFGAGHLRDQLKAEIDRRGLSTSVILRGHDRMAPEALWASSLSLLTSSYEGYPLATLESLARGCPVVAYDIKYGPREQLTDGVDGFLVEDGRVDEVAERVVRLLRDPRLVARMGEAARAKAALHGVDRFVADWAGVLSTVVAAAPRRTAIRDAQVTVRRLRVIRARPWSHWWPLVAPAGKYGVAQLLELDAVMQVRGRGPDGLHDATLELRAIGGASGEVVTVPVQVQRHDRRVHVRSRVRLADVFAPGAPPQETVHLQLRLVWRNSARAQVLAVQPVADDPSVQLAYELGGAVTLTRFHSDEAGSRPQG